MDNAIDIEKLVGDIPELKYVIDTITDILEYMMDDNIKKIKKENKEEYDIKIYEKYREFGDKYYTLFSLILDDNIDKISNLVMMLNTLSMVRTGQISMETANEYVREELSKTYIYSVFGGKKEFERTIMSRNKKN